MQLSQKHSRRLDNLTEWVSFEITLLNKLYRLNICFQKNIREPGKMALNGTRVVKSATDRILTNFAKGTYIICDNKANILSILD